MYKVSLVTGLYGVGLLLCTEFVSLFPVLFHCCSSDDSYRDITSLGNYTYSLLLRTESYSILVPTHFARVGRRAMCRDSRKSRGNTDTRKGGRARCAKFETRLRLLLPTSTFDIIIIDSP